MGIKFVRALLVFIFCVFALPSYGAADENVCMERELLVEQLVLELDEQLLAVWDLGGEGLLELHASAHTGSWTVLLTKSWDLSCVVGDGWNGRIQDILEGGIDT